MLLFAWRQVPVCRSTEALGVAARVVLWVGVLLGGAHGGVEGGSWGRDNSPGLLLLGCTGHSLAAPAGCPAFRSSLALCCYPTVSPWSRVNPAVDRPVHVLCDHMPHRHVRRIHLLLTGEPWCSGFVGVAAVASSWVGVAAAVLACAEFPLLYYVTGAV